MRLYGRSCGHGKNIMMLEPFAQQRVSNFLCPMHCVRRQWEPRFLMIWEIQASGSTRGMERLYPLQVGTPHRHKGVPSSVHSARRAGGFTRDKGHDVDEWHLDQGYPPHTSRRVVDRRRRVPDVGRHAQTRRGRDLKPALHRTKLLVAEQLCSHVRGVQAEDALGD